MALLITFLALTLSSVILIPFFSARWKGKLMIGTVLLNSVVSAIPAVQCFLGFDFRLTLPGSLVTGEIPVSMDALSSWFVLLINFTMLTGAFYGHSYLKAYRDQRNELSVHHIAYVLVHASLISICVLQNSMAFLIAWEIMALSSFVLIIFEHLKHDTLKAGINFLVQSHVSVLFLVLGFIWVGTSMNSFGFKAISDFALLQPHASSLILLILFFIGFAIKAGFVPFHTWLPYAHPAAPAHVSGVMSGVIIKIGIYGILRMLLLVRHDFISIGYIILIVSVISGVYGVMLATIQHNLKKLLAFHSIENIGIIGMGIGLGCLGLGYGIMPLVVLGFAGALLHTLNHSLFKSVLFYASGNVYQATHTMNLERLGGLIKKMPKTSLVFLVAAMAICGLPPFNGFISEFLIYSGILSGLKSANLTLVWMLAFAILGLVSIGGLAIMCFTKAFGSVFLGSPRQTLRSNPEEAGPLSLFPLYAGILLIVLIGIFPSLVFQVLNKPVSQFVSISGMPVQAEGLLSFPGLNWIGVASAGIFGVVGILMFIRWKVTHKREIVTGPTWGCGYVAPNPRMQYTASSYVRTYRKLAEPMLSIDVKKTEISGIFPEVGKHETHPYDKAESWIIDFPVRQLQVFINRFSFLQNGKLQVYILYGVLFISLILIIPLVYDKIVSAIQLLNQM
ncbi:MAG: hypothetical protein HXX13_00445 [Bacteroidetes bacterium]|nr:hypothetical protein [Bacteroidota bacterium]